MTGTVMRASRRLQLNVRITPTMDSSGRQSDDLLAPISDIVFPIGWIEESAEIDEKLAEEFKSKVFAKLFIMKMVLILLLVAGLLLILIPAGICLLRRFSSMCHRKKVTFFTLDRRLSQ